MRPRSIIAIFTALALLMFAFLWGSAVRRAAKPIIAIGVLDCGRESNGVVRVGITNRGRAALIYSKYTFDPSAWVLTVSRTGIATRGIGVGDVRMRGLLRPGSNTVAYFDNVRLRRILPLFFQPATGRARTIDEVFGHQLSGLCWT